MASIAIASPSEKPVTVTRWWLDLVTGTFDGTVIDNGRPVAQTVRITRDAVGKIAGSYTVHQPTGDYDGELVDGHLDGERTLTFTWKDRHGEGVITFQFEPDGSAFKGCWGLAQVDPMLTAVGRRRGR